MFLILCIEGIAIELSNPLFNTGLVTDSIIEQKLV